VKGEVSGTSGWDDVGTILAVLRTIRKWTQDELARKARVRRSSISDYERGEKVPELETFDRLITAMGYSLSIVEETRDFIRSIEARRLSRDVTAQVPSTSSLPAALDAFALEAGRAVTNVARRAFLLIQSCESVSLPKVAEVSAETLFGKLAGRSSEERRALVQTEEFLNWKLVPLLCDESLRTASRKPKLSREWAELAVLLAGRLPGDETRRTKLCGYALAHSGNARRAEGDLATSGAAFEEAIPLLVAGAAFISPLLEEGRPPSLLASLRLAEGRLDECLALLDTARSQAKSASLKTTVLINQARVLEEIGDLEGTIRTLEEAQVIVPNEEPRLLLCIRENLADALSKAGRFEAAEALLPEVRSLARRHASSLDRIRLRWIEGRVAGGLGRTAEAIALLNQVRGDLASEDIVYDTALVSLELAKLFASEGRTAEVRTLARHMVPIFQSQQIHREALAALAFFRQAAERDVVTVELAEEVRAYLAKARRNPGLRFEP
jgi:transcriptional regulator with XRE-family HTH domain